MIKTTILVCGASGFIGRNIFESLSKRPDLIVYGTCLSDRPILGELIPADMTDYESARLLTKGMDIVIHAAAKTDGASAVNKNPAGYFPDNIRINTNLIQASCDNNVRHFIFMSCQVMYPHTSRPTKETEADIYNVYPPYFMGARVKVFAEDFCKFYSEISETSFTVIRHCTTYGPYDKFGPKGHACPALIAQAVNSTDGTITLYGASEEKRDLLYVSDLIRFIEIALDRTGNKFEIFNVGLGRSVSIKEMAEKIIEASGRQLEIKFDMTKKSMAIDMMLDISKAQKILGWQPEVSLEEGLKQTIDWYKKSKTPN